MAEVETSVHVRVWKVAEPFRELFVKFFLGEASDLLRLGGINLKKTL